MKTPLEHITPPGTETAHAGPTRLEKLLPEHPFIKGLDPHQLRLLSDCAMEVNYQPGELIFKEGDPANRFYLVLEGSVRLEAHVHGKGRIPIQIVRAGEVLGWSWLFSPYHWHFDAVALEPTKLLFFYATPLREECETDHDLGYELIKRMSEMLLQRLQATRRRLAPKCAKPCKQVGSGSAPDCRVLQPCIVAPSPPSPLAD